VDLQAALVALKAEGIKSLMVEGGARVMASFFTLRDGDLPVVDVHLVTVSPMMIGNGGYNPVAFLDKVRLSLTAAIHKPD
jgi:2,5-diamino-6-(ribosylamino)-4(3H)-pyrimidinone 5'-phosphate reductase